MPVVCHWFETDRMKLKRIRNEKTEQLWKHEPLISHWAVGLCFDFDPYVRNVAPHQTHIPDKPSLLPHEKFTYTADVVNQPRHFGV